MRRLNLYLGLARASNLPTVWTNALAASALSIAALDWYAWVVDWRACVVLAIAGSLLYAGGCTLNDAFDEHWDRQHRPERPIPSGRLSAREVWTVGLVELLGGLGLLGIFGLLTLASGGAVVLAILLYDYFHKKWRWAVLLMGWCRGQWVITAALAASGGLGTWVLVYGACLFGYIVYISLAARREALSDSGIAGSTWRTPVVMSLVAAGILGLKHDFIAPALLGFALFILWVARARREMQGGGPKIGIFVSRALAGIVLLDAAFACLCWGWFGLWILVLLPVCLLLQRRIAAT